MFLIYQSCVLKCLHVAYHIIIIVKIFKISKETKNYRNSFWQGISGNFLICMFIYDMYFVLYKDPLLEMILNESWKRKMEVRTCRQGKFGRLSLYMEYTRETRVHCDIAGGVHCDVYVARLKKMPYGLRCGLAYDAAEFTWDYLERKRPTQGCILPQIYFGIWTYDTSLFVC